MILKFIVVILALLFLGNMVDIPIIFLGIQGALPLTFVFIACFLCDFIPDFFWYGLGYKIGIERFSRWKFLKRKMEKLAALGNTLDKYGGLLIFGSKFASGLGIPIQVVMGAHRYDLKKMAMANALGNAGWLLLVYTLVHEFASLDLVEDLVKDTRLAFLVFFLAAVLLHFILSKPFEKIIGK